MANQQDKGKKRKRSKYMHYTSIAFQMIAALLLGIFVGLKLDEWLNTSPIFTIVLVLVGLGAAMYIVMKDLVK